MKIVFTLYFIFEISSFLFTQNDSRVSHNYNISLNNQFENGQIISSKNGRLRLDSDLYKSNQTADPYMIGVFSALTSNSIITEGIVLVKSSNSNDPIKIGDFITTNVDGLAIKIKGKGWSLGVAIEDESNGFVLTRLYIHYKD
jgi:hypothetical protein